MMKLSSVCESSCNSSREQVIPAAYAMQQLPKIFCALSNMARRSRVQLARRGMFFGGNCLEQDSIRKQQGILKTQRSPNLCQLDACNEFWKTFSYTFSNEECDSAFSKIGGSDCHLLSQCRIPNKLRHLSTPGTLRPHQTLDFISSPLPTSLCTPSSVHMCGRGAIHRSQTILFLESLPMELSSLPSLQSILHNHLKARVVLSPGEYEIMQQLYYLKMLFSISLHKLLRKRPREFILPLPKRKSRTTAHQGKSRIDVQTVGSLPSADYKRKWLKFNNPNNSKVNSRTNPRVLGKPKRVYSLAVPKGFAFLTYPDFKDDTSFEGTIGGRNIISWAKGTKFPQMGIDQSVEFRKRKELGRQYMIQCRIRGARIHKNAINSNNNGSGPTPEASNRNSFFYSARRKTFSQKVIKPNDLLTVGNRSNTRNFQSWFKTKNMKANNTNQPRLVDPAELFSNSRAAYVSVDETMERLTRRRRRAVVRAERRKRMKMCAKTVIGYLSCGIIPYVMKHECIFRKKRHLSTSESREILTQQQVLTPSVVTTTEVTH